MFKILRISGLIVVSINLLLLLLNFNQYFDVMSVNNYVLLLLLLGSLIAILVVRKKMVWYLSICFCLFYITILLVEQSITGGVFSQSINVPLYHFFRLTKASEIGRILMIFSFIYLLLLLITNFTKEGRKYYK